MILHKACTLSFANNTFSIKGTPSLVVQKFSCTHNAVEMALLSESDVTQLKCQKKRRHRLTGLSCLMMVRLPRGKDTKIDFVNSFVIFDPK